MFELAGWDTEVTQDSNDGGVDVTAFKNTFYEEKASIQVKRPDPGNKVGQPDVQQYSAIDRDDTDTDVVVVATSAAFTSGGYEYGRENNIKLIDGAMLAGFVEAQEAEDVLDQYAPPAKDIDLDGEDVFSPVEKPREQYLRKRPIEASARIFREENLIDAVEVIQNTEVGLNQINCLIKLKESIGNSNADAPSNIFLEYPQLIDQNWYDVEHLDDVADKLVEVANGGRITPPDFEVLCFSNRENVSVSVFLSPTNPVGHEEFEFLEACVDAVAQLSSSDDNPNGRIYGSKLEGINEKIRRNKNFGIKASTYSQVLKRAVLANDELLRAVRPYFYVSDDQKTMEKISQLQDEVNQN